MAGIYRSKLFRLFAVATLMTVLQGPIAQAQECDSVRTNTCCSTYSQCPTGYYKVSQCDSLSTSVPSPPQPDDDDESFNSTDSGNDTSTDATTEMTFNTSDSEGTSTSPSSIPAVYCMRCEDNCFNCSASRCFTYMNSFLPKNGQCVSSNASESFPVAAVVGGVVGGVAFIVVVVVVIVFVCRRKPTIPAQSPLHRTNDMSSTQDSSSDAESGISEGKGKEDNPDYENMGRKMKDMPTQILRGQDNVLRYTKDPTAKKTVPETIEIETTYTNQATINLNQMNQEAREIQQLPAAPAVPKGAQPSNKHKKKKKSRKAKVGEVPQDEPTPAAEPESIYVNTAAVVRESLEEEQVYENETTSPYVNFGFQN
ncbi:uncharacterized protein [Haliotis asinina]|uniref:uncharacterized protein n=1 Tax=Haliotis asinina TaxID=109174 RepID=UPI0035325763